MSATEDYIESAKTHMAVKPEVLTREEAIQLIQGWVKDDDDFEPTERRTSEEMTDNLIEAGAVRGTDQSDSDLRELVRQYAPNAPKAIVSAVPTKTLLTANLPPYPDDLKSLIDKGVAFVEDGFWLANRCQKCGQFGNTCCGEVSLVSVVRHNEKALTAFGRQAVGLDPIVRPKPPKTSEQLQQEQERRNSESPWWFQFRGVGELEGNGTIKMYIENFLTEGITLICGLPKEGKSFLALSIAKALTSGQPLFGRVGFEVPEIIPVLYLAAESGDGALKLRCERMGMTKDKSLFICRTLTQGMLTLEDQNIESLVRSMRPIIILETLVRFNDGTDEDSATENRKLAQAIFSLISKGARAVIGIHHSRKDLNKANPTKEAAVRGSGDGLAMVDCIWLVMQDERLYQRGKGPTEIDVVGWGRDFSPVPMRLALTQKAPKDATLTFAPGIISFIDTQGDFGWVDKNAQPAPVEKPEQVGTVEERLERLITENPTITRDRLVEETSSTQRNVRAALKRLGYYRPRGGKNGAMSWVRNS